MTAQSEIRKRALIKLGVGSRNQTPTNDVDDDMKKAYTETYAMLQEIDVAYWGELLDVPDEVGNEVASLMAWARVNDYGVSNDRYTRIEKESIKAMNTLRMMSVNAYNNRNEPEDF